MLEDLKKEAKRRQGLRDGEQRRGKMLRRAKGFVWRR